MSKVWGGKSYDEDFYEVDGQGQRTTGVKDWDADNAYWAANGRGTAAAPAAAPTGSSVAPTPTAAAPNTDWQGLSNNVQNRINTDINWGGTVDTNDPAFKQQMDANALQTNLAADRSRAAMQQRRAATGTGTSGAVDTDVNKALEQQAYQNKSFEAGLFDKFRQQGLDKQQAALTLGSGMLTAEQERALRGALTREGYDVQRDIAADDLSYRRDALGQNLALSQAQMDQNAMLALLGGNG